jgi:arylsulfatase A-like enzyme
MTMNSAVEPPEAISMTPAQEQASAPISGKPNIVLVLMDNRGYGELGVYGGGILRGTPTPKVSAHQAGHS